MRCSETSLELLKATRNGPLTREEIASAVGCNPATMDRWIADYFAQGVLLRRRGPKEPQMRGQGRFVYWLSPVWGGTFNYQGQNP